MKNTKETCNETVHMSDLEKRMDKFIKKIKARRRIIHEKFLTEQKTRKKSSTKKKFSGVVEAADWTREHPMFWDKSYVSRFHECFLWFLVLVNPRTDFVDENKAKNTKQQCWLECGPFIYTQYEFMIGKTSIPSGSHDPKLDVSDNTFEKAILKLAQKIYQYYGDYRKEDI